VQLFITWYSGFRPYISLNGRTPDEVYLHLPAANRRLRFEARHDWPRSSPSAAPQALVKGAPGARLQVDVRFLAGRKHLPVVTLQRAA